MNSILQWFSIFGESSIHFTFKFLFSFFFLVFLALTSEKEYDLAELSHIDTEEAKEYSKEHTLSLLKKIREHLSTLGIEAAALPEDEAQKYLLTVSVCFHYSKLHLYYIF